MSILSTLQAISLGIESIKKRSDLPQKKQQEAIKILERLSSRDWYINWDKESIIKALRDYKERTGKAPTVTNLVETGMPKSITIQSHFQMRASLLLKQLFPENRNLDNKKTIYHNPFGFNTEDEWLNCFIEQFNKHSNKNMTSQNYNILRDKGTPTWGTIAKNCGMSTWGDLMKRAGVEYPAKKNKTATNVKIRNTDSPTLKKLEELNTQRYLLNLELYEILTKK